MDPIADMVTHLKNTNVARKASAVFPYSNVKMAIASVLEREKYIGAVAKKGKKVKKLIEVEMLYGIDGKPKIKGVRRISKPSRREYYSVHDVGAKRHSIGTLLLSTPKGILTGREAYTTKVGGEALFRIW